MKNKDLTDLKIIDAVVCAPKDYVGLPLIFDDYDMNAEVLNLDEKKVMHLKQFINAETNFVYGPASSVKGRYSYNRDD